MHPDTYAAQRSKGYGKSEMTYTKFTSLKTPSYMGRSVGDAEKANKANKVSKEEKINRINGAVLVRERTRSAVGDG